MDSDHPLCSSKNDFHFFHIMIEAQIRLPGPHRRNGTNEGENRNAASISKSILYHI